MFGAPGQPFPRTALPQDCPSPGPHTTTQELQTCTFDGSRQREKKERNFGRSGGRGVRRRGSLGERPNLRYTHENFEHTPHHNTTQHKHNTTQHNTTQHNTTTTHTHNTTGGSQGGLGQGGSLAGRSMPQIVPKSSSIGQGFLGPPGETPEALPGPNALIRFLTRTYRVSKDTL